MVGLIVWLKHEIPSTLKAEIPSTLKAEMPSTLKAEPETTLLVLQCTVNFATADLILHITDTSQKQTWDKRKTWTQYQVYTYQGTFFQAELAQDYIS